jgi:hypothetical protein
MPELTTYELDAELAEQLPARELMNCGCRCGCGGIEVSVSVEVEVGCI